MAINKAVTPISNLKPLNTLVKDKEFIDLERVKLGNQILPGSSSSNSQAASTTSLNSQVQEHIQNPSPVKSILSTGVSMLAPTGVGGGIQGMLLNVVTSTITQSSNKKTNKKNTASILATTILSGSIFGFAGFSPCFSEQTTNDFGLVQLEQVSSINQEVCNSLTNSCPFGAQKLDLASNQVICECISDQSMEQSICNSVQTLSWDKDYLSLV